MINNTFRYGSISCITIFENRIVCCIVISHHFCLSSNSEIRFRSFLNRSAKKQKRHQNNFPRFVLTFFGIKYVGSAHLMSSD